MTKNPSEDNLDMDSSIERQSVTLEDVLDVNQGDAIAVRAVLEGDEWLLAGRVVSTLTEKTEKETVLEQLREENANTPLLSIDAEAWWKISDGKLVDRSHELEDRPPMQEYLGDPPKDPPQCSLTYWGDDRVGLTIPMPVENASRVLYYAGEDYGTVVALDHGVVVDPEQLLPTASNVA